MWIPQNSDISSHALHSIEDLLAMPDYCICICLGGHHDSHPAPAQEVAMGCRSTACLACALAFRARRTGYWWDHGSWPNSLDSWAYSPSDSGLPFLLPSSLLAPGLPFSFPFFLPASPLLWFFIMLTHSLPIILFHFHLQMQAVSNAYFLACSIPTFSNHS